MVSEPESVLFSGRTPGLIWHAIGFERHPVIVSVHGGGGNKADVDPVAVERVFFEVSLFVQ
jgi:hypothetical protein